MGGEAAGTVDFSVAAIGQLEGESEISTLSSPETGRGRGATAAQRARREGAGPTSSLPLPGLALPALRFYPGPPGRRDAAMTPARLQFSEVPLMQAPARTSPGPSIVGTQKRATAGKIPGSARGKTSLRG